VQARKWGLRVERWTVLLVSADAADCTTFLFVSRINTYRRKILTFLPRVRPCCLVLARPCWQLNSGASRRLTRQCYAGQLVFGEVKTVLALFQQFDGRRNVRFIDRFKSNTANLFPLLHGHHRQSRCNIHVPAIRPGLLPFKHGPVASTKAQ